MITDTRDLTKARVYGAEHRLERILDNQADHQQVTIAGSHLTVPAERRFASVDSIQAYVDQVQAMPRVQEAFPFMASVPVTVVARRGDTKATYVGGPREIRIPAKRSNDKYWAMRETVVLHELAHHLSQSRPAHGPLFQQALVELLDAAMGPEAAFMLRVFFHETV